MWLLDTPCGKQPHQAQAFESNSPRPSAGGWLGLAGREVRRSLWQEVWRQGLDRERARQLLEACGLALAGEERVLLGLSGGADSVLLLALVARAELPGRVQVVHVRHGLRGRESARDGAFCRWLCRRLGLPGHFPRAPVVPGSNLEARARQARRRAFAAVSNELGDQAAWPLTSGGDDRSARAKTAGQASPWLLLGHTGQDHAETVLWRWLRGGSLAAVGLAETLEEATPGADSLSSQVPAQADPDGRQEPPDAPLPSPIRSGHAEQQGLSRAALAQRAGAAPGTAGPRASAHSAAQVPHTPDAPAALENATPWRPLRPLSDLSREEVRQLGQALGLCWREDSSNRSEAHARNRLRLRLLPALAAAQATTLSTPSKTEFPVGEGWSSTSAKRPGSAADAQKTAPSIFTDSAAINALQRLGHASWDFEAELQRWLPKVTWAPAVWSSALFDPRSHQALELDPHPLRGLSALLLERLLRRLCWQATGREPGRALLTASAALLGTKQAKASPWPAGHVLWARPGQWCLLPPFSADRKPPGKPAVTAPGPAPDDPSEAASDRQSRRDADRESGHRANSWRWQLPDGRRLSASLAGAAASTRGAQGLELSSSGLDFKLEAAPSQLRLPPGPAGKPRVGDLAAQAGIPPPARRRLWLLRDSLGPLWIPGLWQRPPGLGNSQVPLRVSLDWPGSPEHSTTAPALASGAILLGPSGDPTGSSG